MVSGEGCSSVDSIACRSRRPAANPMRKKSGRMLVSVGEQFSQISGSSSTETTERSSGMRMPAFPAAVMTAAPMTSFTAKTPLGWGRFFSSAESWRMRRTESCAAFRQGVMMWKGNLCSRATVRRTARFDSDQETGENQST